MSTATRLDLDDGDHGPGREEDLAGRILVENPHLRIVLCGNDEVLVKHGTRSPYSEVIRDAGRTGLIGRLVTGFARPNSLTALGAKGVVGPSELPLAVDLVSDLLDRGVLVESGTELLHVYFDTILGANGSATRLRQCEIGLIGCGSLGPRWPRG